MKLLLHTCCAPCSIKCIDSLAEEQIKPALFWYNPNIHPFTEYRSRRDTLVKYAADAGLELINDDEYGLRSFIRGLYAENVMPEESFTDGSPQDFLQSDYRPQDYGPQRCAYCYRLRLEKTAARAVEDGYDYFSTTLLISPYQNHDLIRQIGEELGDTYGVKFLYRDFRPLFRAGQAKARELGLYMQKYCGCIFSEEERYLSI
jgi:predicted adenine nucleotide alpha hydrolase (AANH) superfamily ATPase